MSKHTPGPWEIEGSNVIAREIPTGEESDADAVIAECGVSWLSGDETEANACLIAAAPDLLECLKGFTRNVRQLNDEHFSGLQEKLVAMANEAIAKAEGVEEKDE